MCTLLISSRRQKCEVCGSTRPDQNSISSCTNQIDGRIAKQSSKSSLGDTESVMKQDKCPKINAWVKGRKKESALPQRVELPLHKTYLREQNQRNQCTSPNQVPCFAQTERKEYCHRSGFPTKKIRSVHFS